MIIKKSTGLIYSKYKISVMSWIGSKIDFSSINNNNNDNDNNGTDDLVLRPFKLIWEDELQNHPILGISHLKLLEQKLKYQFNDLSNLAQAVCHKSFLLEHPEIVHIKAKYLNSSQYSTDTLSYEPFELLGDSVLGLAAVELVHVKYPHENINFRNKLKQGLVCANTAVLCAKHLELDQHICVGNSVAKINNRILEDSFEAIIGAMYQDSNFNFSKTSNILIKELLDPLFPILHQQLLDISNRWKSLLQEDFSPGSGVKYISKPAGKMHPKSNAFEPPPAFWTSEAYIDNQFVGKGQGKSKKHAEMDAAKNAYRELTQKRN